MSTKLQRQAGERNRQRNAARRVPAMDAARAEKAAGMPAAQANRFAATCAAYGLDAAMAEWDVLAWLFN